MNITDDELERLKKANTEKEWNDACSAVKAARDGQYPPDWWPKVKLSGIMDAAISRFGGELKVVVPSNPLDPWR